MSEDPLGHSQAGALQHAGPDHAVEPRDILADDVNRSRPQASQLMTRLLKDGIRARGQDGALPYHHCCPC